MRVGVCLPKCVRVGFGVIYTSLCLFNRLVSCWLWYDLCELVFVYQVMFVWLRYVLCELVFVFQVVFVLASVCFMRVGVCFPGSVRVGFGMIYASWCLFSRLCSC